MASDVASLDRSAADVAAANVRGLGLLVLKVFGRISGEFFPAPRRLSRRTYSANIKARTSGIRQQRGSYRREVSRPAVRSSQRTKRQRVPRTGARRRQPGCACSAARAGFNSDV